MKTYLLRCVDRGSYRLTVGKTYIGRKYQDSLFEFHITNDIGYEHGVECGLFIDVKEERIKKLKELGI
jgi:hypothetical protein